MILLIQRVLILLGSASHLITEEHQRVVWTRTNPKSSLLGNKEKEKDTTLFSGVFFGESYQTVGRRENSGKGYKKYTWNKQPPSKKMISDVFWRKKPLQSTEAEIRGTQTRPWKTTKSFKGTPSSKGQRTLVKQNWETICTHKNTVALIYQLFWIPLPLVYSVPVFP